jgi:hypothetical protein
MPSHRVLSLILVPALALLASTARAQEPAAEEQPLLHAAVLVGDTHTSEQNGLTIGGDLEVRPWRYLGVGVTGEHVKKPFRENIWLVAAVVHPTHGLKLVVGPGVERDRHGDTHDAEQHALLRVGVGYDVPLRHGWTFDPDVAVDFVSGERVFVYAFAVGKEFGARKHRP